MQYRLLCCSDTHGRLPPSLDERGATAWLHGGDVCNGWDKAVQNGEFEPIDHAIAEWFRSRAIPVYVVRGNHDVNDPYAAFSASHDATGFVLPVAPELFVAGLGWRGEYHFDLPTESDLAKICADLRRQVLRKVTRHDSLILLTHYPARLPELFPSLGIGEGCWYDCIRELIDDLRPVAVVQGHIHSLFGHAVTWKTQTGAVAIVNPGRGGAELVIDPAGHSATAHCFATPNED